MCCASSPPRPAPPDLAVFDLDGTITRADTLLPFVLGYVWRTPRRLPRLLWALAAAVRFVFDGDRGALKGALIHATLGGLTREQLAHWTGQFVARLLRHGVYRQALEAIDAHRLRGDRLVLMSASTDLYVPQIAQALGFDEVICTQIRWNSNGRLDGRLASPNCRKMEKRRQLLALTERLAPRKVYTYGNSSADLPHMQLAQEAILVNGPWHLRRGRPVDLQHVGLQRVRWRR